MTDAAAAAGADATSAVARALDRALGEARAHGAEDVEVSYLGTETAFTRFASSRFTQVGTVHEELVRVRVCLGAGATTLLGTCTASSLGLEAVAAAARTAVDTARAAPALGVALSFGAPDETVAATTGTAATAASLTVPEALAWANAPSTLARAFAVAAKQGAACAGALKINRRTACVRTAAGRAKSGADLLVDLSLIATVDGSSGFAGAVGRPGATDELGATPDGEALAAVATDKALRGRRPVDLGTGAYDVVLAPKAVAELVEWMSMASFGAQSVLEETSLLCGRAGEPLCAAAITLEDRGGVGAIGFDAEGTTRQTVTFLDRGRAGRPVTDRLTAVRLGDARGSTGHAAEVGAYDPAPHTAHLALRPGDKSEADLIASVDRGLYVTRFHYVNGLLDTYRATMTGMTRDGTFLIEGGRLGGGVRNLRFTDSILDAWATRLGGLGHTTFAIPTWWTSAGIVSVPAMLLGAFRFTGQSRP
jgi:predicted Zn-dependent protease